jgi:hypothetical protein
VEGKISDDEEHSDEMVMDSEEDEELRPMRELFPDTQEFKDKLLELVDTPTKTTTLARHCF